MIKRLIRAFTTWPGPRDWAACLVIAAVSLGLMAVIACLGGFWHWQPRFGGWPLRLLSVILVPSLTEETIFRGLLPERGDSRRPWLWIGLGVAAFILWHVIEALTFLPGAKLFLTPAFLIAAGVLGLACAVMRYRTGSIWPGVMMHAATVFLWQVLLGGPDVRSLLA